MYAHENVIEFIFNIKLRNIRINIYIYYINIGRSSIYFCVYIGGANIYFHSV